MKYFIILLSCVIYLTGCNSSNPEGEIMRKLLDPNNYNKNLIPQTTLDGPLVLDLGVNLYKILSICEKHQRMKSNMRLTMVWKDRRLQHSSTELGGKPIRMPLSKIWSPKLRLANLADGEMEYGDVNALVYDDGTVIVYTQPVVVTTSCTIDVTYFPYDQQTCIMKFFVDGYNGNEVTMKLYNDRNFMNLKEYSASEDYFIIEVPSYLNVYNTKELNEVDITFYITLRRKIEVYTWTLVAPTVIASVLAIFGFVLPIDSREKLICGLFSVISLAFILVRVSLLLPTMTFAIPVFVKYNLFALLVSTILLICTAVVLNLSSKVSTMPDCVRKIFLDYLGKWLRITENSEKDALDISTVASPAESMGQGQSIGVASRNSTTSATDATSGAEKSILSSLTKLKEKKQVKADWKKVALVLDRILFVVSIVVIPVAFFVYLSDFPHLGEKLEEDKIIDLYSSAK